MVEFGGLVCGGRRGSIPSSIYSHLEKQPVDGRLSVYHERARCLVLRAMFQL